jgi:hypothetical protein
VDGPKKARLRGCLAVVLFLVAGLLLNRYAGIDLLSGSDDTDYDSRPLDWRRFE